MSTRSRAWSSEGTRAQIAIKLFGPDLATLRNKAGEIREAMEGVEGVVDLLVEPQVGVSQVQINMDRQAAAAVGLSAEHLADTVDAAFNGHVASQVLEEQKTYDVLVRFDDSAARAVFAFGRSYKKEPFYMFPGVIAAKLPLGLLLLTVIGTVLFFARKIPPEFVAPLSGVIGLAVLFLVVLSTGSSYGGIRHALPVIPPLALLAAAAAYVAVKSKSNVLRGAAAAALVGALLSAIPVLRPWEYYNETVGGAANAYLYFGDEGIDAELRVKELVKYYDENLRSAGELPFLLYPVHQAERKSRQLDWVGKDLERDGERMNSETISGTIILGARRLRGAAFRDATPIARFGNLFVFRGTFKFPEARMTSLTVRARNKIYTAEPDIEGAIKLLSEAVAINPKRYDNAVELGNQYLKVGRREEALRAYRVAKEHAPADEEISELLVRQIERVAAEPLEQISPLRNPKIE